jgi:hypothetical protein
MWQKLCFAFYDESNFLWPARMIVVCRGFHFTEVLKNTNRNCIQLGKSHIRCVLDVNVGPCISKFF